MDEGDGYSDIQEVHKKRRKFFNNKRRLPDRWECYEPVGKDIPGTRFVAFKTPLKSDFFASKVDSSTNSNSRYTFQIENLLQMASVHKKKIGLVIDLTATNRYYDPSEWIERGTQYVKIRCFGHEAHKQLDAVMQFHNAVSNYLGSNSESNRLIGVHCTHGVNRTGYMICRYLIEVNGWDPARAIEDFEYCRGYKIERKKYVDSLYSDCKPGNLSRMAANPWRTNFRS